MRSASDALRHQFQLDLAGAVQAVGGGCRPGAGTADHLAHAARDQQRPAIPWSPLPALLLMTVGPRAAPPPARVGQLVRAGQAVPKPPIITVAPSGTDQPGLRQGGDSLVDHGWVTAAGAGQGPSTVALLSCAAAPSCPDHALAHSVAPINPGAAAAVAASPAHEPARLTACPADLAARRRGRRRHANASRNWPTMPWAAGPTPSLFTCSAFGSRIGASNAATPHCRCSSPTKPWWTRQWNGLRGSASGCWRRSAPRCRACRRVSARRHARPGTGAHGHGRAGRQRHRFPRTMPTWWPPRNAQPRGDLGGAGAVQPGAQRRRGAPRHRAAGADRWTARWPRCAGWAADHAAAARRGGPRRSGRLA